MLTGSEREMRWLPHALCDVQSFELAAVVGGTRTHPPFATVARECLVAISTGPKNKKSCRGGSRAEHAQVLRNGPNALHNITPQVISADNAVISPR